MYVFIVCMSLAYYFTRNFLLCKSGLPNAKIMDIRSYDFKQMKVVIIYFNQVLPVTE